MIIYSNKIFQFIKEIRFKAKEILSLEIGLKVSGDRFYDKKQKVSYPIHIVIFNNKSMLGYFNPDFYELGFHECLMHTSQEYLSNLIRHELAHMITFINYGSTVQPHGTEFKSFCQQMGWAEEVYRAASCLEGALNAADIEESSILRKIKKLMALASSSNTNEAEQAMIKSQQLLLKHNIESKYIGGEDEEQMYLKRIMKQKKENAKMRTIAKILETFFVNTVYRRAGDSIYLEILGNATNVEIAEYVACVLQGELDRLWKQAQCNCHLKGMIAKNSFFLGIAKGYCEKIQFLKREYDKDVKNELMVLEKKLGEAKAMAYPRLSTSKSQGSLCRKSSLLGEQMGRQLNINPAVDSSSKSSAVQIAFLG